MLFPHVDLFLAIARTLFWHVNTLVAIARTKIVALFTPYPFCILAPSTSMSTSKVAPQLPPFSLSHSLEMAEAYLPNWKKEKEEEARSNLMAKF